MLPFCEPGDGESIIWRHNGFSRCLATVLSSLVPSGVIIVAGITLIVLKCQPNKSRSEPNSQSHSISRWLLQSKILFLEVALCFFMSITYVFELLVHSFLPGAKLYGYLVVACPTSAVAWLFCVYMVIRERFSILYGLHHSIPVIVFWLGTVLSFCFAVSSWQSSEWWWHFSVHNDRGNIDITDLVMFCCRVVSLMVLVVVGILIPLLTRKSQYRLLVNINEASGQEPPVVHVSSQNEEDRVKAGGFSGKSSEGSTFGNIVKKTKAIFPFVWPRGHPFLQLQVIICLLILVVGRVVNLLVPIYYKKIINSLTPGGHNQTSQLDLKYGMTHQSTGITFPAVSVFIYVILRFLQGGSVGSSGLVNNIRSFLWINVQQYTSRSMQVDLFRHLHGLSLRWHLGRKTGEILRVIDRGMNSINNLLSYILFNILPTFVDIGVAVVFFVVAFDAWFGLIVFTTMISYLLFTIYITEWRTKYRRRTNEKDNKARAISVDSLLNFETVKYYGQEAFEVQRFNGAIVDFQKEEWKSLASLNVLGIGQNVIISLGLLGGALLCAYRVTQGYLTVGDFVLYATYIVQLYVPLNFFGTYYRMIQQAFIDMENVFDLMDVEREVDDTPNAKDLILSSGKIEFRNVYFHYNPERPILRHVSFAVNPGETIALVGPSGAGKSTIIRLLFRFYDIQDGCILIDGQDISDVKQSSLRRCIGVVPQDTVLFNDDIYYNIRYGRVDATGDEVVKASEYADIHEKIQAFPKKYDTLVGERGLKLSGGEKQRVAIARTILKNPAIILLDEATSALDTQTERNIQGSLMRVCEGRSTIIVAHRLSTIIHADQILVLKEGEIIERGKHDELLSLGGVYSAMWSQQQQSLQEEQQRAGGEGRGLEEKETNI